jgi:uncharacterized protein (TIGR04141 family)
LEKFLDPLCIDIALPPYQHASEGAYNVAAAQSNNSIICLDQENISPTSQSQVEPCDLYEVKNDYAVFEHVKVSTLSSQLSHLFNQGTNAIELLKLEQESLDKLKALIKQKASAGTEGAMLAPLIAQKHEVTFAIVTHKDKNQKSKNLPLFSRISLMRNMKSLQVMSVRAGFGFIEDRTPKTAGKKKQRKKRQ